MKLRDLFELIRIHLPREEGQTMAEYGLLIALIAILVIGAITLFKGALTGTQVAVEGTYFDILKQDVQNGTLPQVSYIVAPEAYSEHGNWPPNFGAWYVDQVLQVLTSNPEVWSASNSSLGMRWTWRRLGAFGSRRAHIDSALSQ